MANKFLVIFGAEEADRLSPFNDDKPKRAKICRHKALRVRVSLAHLELAAISRNAILYYRDMYLRPEYYAEKEAVAKALLSDLIAEVENGTKDYDTALKEAYTKIYQSINPAYVPNEEIGVDRIYLDIPAAGTVTFTQARKLLKEAQTRSVQK